jgi:hypothetical protein
MNPKTTKYSKKSDDNVNFKKQPQFGERKRIKP